MSERIDFLSVLSEDSDKAAFVKVVYCFCYQEA